MLSLAQSPSLPAGTRSPTACTMAPENAVLPSVVKPERFIGLDIHKAYLVAAGVDAEQHQLLPFQRVEWKQFGPWLRRTLTSRDALVVEMTTNTWEVYDALVEHVQSVTVVHPPHVALITRARVMTDKRAALVLAQLHAAGLLAGIWVPPPEVRDQRLLVAQRWKMVQLATVAKTRLHSVLHRHHLAPPAGSQPFHSKHEPFWLNLVISEAEKAAVHCDWQTLQFAKQQQVGLEKSIGQVAVSDTRVPLLLQLPGVGTLVAVTILSAFGDIKRFPTAEQLVGYAGLGASVHASGLTNRTGRMTKAGRRDIRRTEIEAAHSAARTHPHRKAVLERLEPRTGYNKAIGAIGRKLLVAVWHVLSRHEVDRFAQPEQVARKLRKHAAMLSKANRPTGQTAAMYVRTHLDELGIGADVDAIRLRKSKTIPLPTSSLPGAKMTM